MVSITLHLENNKTNECAIYTYNDENISFSLTFLFVSLTGFKVLSQQANTKLYDEYKFADGWRIDKLLKRVSFYE